MLSSEPGPAGAARQWPRWVAETFVVVAAAGIDLMVWSEDRTLRDGQLLSLWVVPSLTAVLYPVLLLRWRFPRAVFALHWVYSLAGVPLPDYVPFAGLLVALHALGRRGSTGWAGVGLAASVVPFAVNSFNVAGTVTEVDPVVGFAGNLFLWSVLTLLVWGFGRWTAVLERRAEQDRTVRGEQAAAAVRAERLHLARELHDIVSHSVSAMILQAAGARALASSEDEQVRAALEAIETTGIDAMNELHRLLGLLRATDPDGGLQGLSAARSLQDLDSLVSSARASGVDVEVVVEGHPDELDRSVGLAVYRIVQEALTNTVKHAGRGASARIHLHWESHGLTLTIRDKAGFDARRLSELSSGHGLAGLTERVTLVGGSMEAGPVSDGFLLRAHLPTRLPARQHRRPAPSVQDTP